MTMPGSLRVDVSATSLPTVARVQPSLGRDVYSLLAKALALRPGVPPVIVEIGANDHTDTRQLYRIARAQHPGAALYAFEPDPRFGAALTPPIGPGVHLIDAAVGKADGEATLYLSDGKKEGDPRQWQCSSSIRKPKEHLKFFPHIKFEQTARVAVRSLDSWYAAEHGIAEISFIWVDAQGAERDVLAGGSKALAATRFLFLERCDDELYEGQLLSGELLDAVAAEWGVVELLPHDVFLYNRRIFGARSPI